MVGRGARHRTVRGPVDAEEWLFRILVNRARSAGARERRTDSLDDQAGPVVPSERFDRAGSWATPPEVWAEAAEDRLVAEQLAKRVKACLEDLPSAQREVVLLRDVEGLPTTEVCNVLGINDGHMRVLLHRARARVRHQLATEMGRAD